MVTEHHACNRAVENARQRIRCLPICKANRKAILAFSDFCFSEGLGARRVLKYLSILPRVARLLSKDFAKVGRKDIERLVQRIEQSPYSEWTKHDYRVALKKFFRWLRQTEEYPPEVRWLRSTVRDRGIKLPEEILSQREVEDMIVAATSTRDRALIATLYESGCRIGELLSLRIRHIQQHPHGFQIVVKGKTGPRRLLLIACAPYLAAWLNEHPRREQPDAPLWVTSDSRAEQLCYVRVRAILRRAARRAGVRKAVNPHSFRHARATHLASHLTEAQMNEYFVWVQGSAMASTYVHLSGRDIDNALLKLNNIPVNAEESDPNGRFALRSCPRCQCENPPGNKFCSRCGAVLDEATAKAMMTQELERPRADSLLDAMLQDEEFREVFIRKARELATGQGLQPDHAPKAQG